MNERIGFWKKPFLRERCKAGSLLPRFDPISTILHSSPRDK
jgi:hypothetical protein